MTETETLPRAALHQVQQVVGAAKAAHFAVTHNPNMPHDHVNRFWRHFANLATAAETAPDGDLPEGLAKRLAIAQTAKRAMDAFAGLPEQTLASLLHWHRAHWMGNARVWQQWTLIDPATVLSDHPVLGPIQKEIGRGEAERAAIIEAVNARAQAAAEERRPAELLARLRAAGVVLGLDGKGNITAPPGAPIGPIEREGLALHKAAIVALLRVEAEALKPVVVA